MKKILFLFLILILLSLGPTCFAGTYEAILTDNGYTELHNNYLDRLQLKSILEIIFKKSFDYDAEQTGNSVGNDFFEMLENGIGLDSSVIENKDAYSRRALTFNTLCELMDNYFEHIAKLHGLDSVPGKLSKSDLGYVLTYGEGIVLKFAQFESFQVTEKLYDVWVILQDGKVIDVCKKDKDVPFSKINLTKEVKGNLYFIYDNGIIIEDEGKLYEYPLSPSFKFINRENAKKVVLILGEYKRNKNIAAIAIGRTE